MPLVLLAPAWASTPEDAYRASWRRWQQGDVSGAERVLQAAVARFPSHGRLRLFWAACVASHQAEEEADALFEPLVAQAARTNGTSVEAEVAEAYLHLSDPTLAPKALASLARVALRSQSDPLYLWIYAQAAARVGRPEQAVAAFGALVARVKTPPAVVRQGYAAALEADGRLHTLQERRLVLTQEFPAQAAKRRV